MGVLVSFLLQVINSWLWGLRFRTIGLRRLCPRWGPVESSHRARSSTKQSSKKSFHSASHQDRCKMSLVCKRSPTKKSSGCDRSLVRLDRHRDSGRDWHRSMDRSGHSSSYRDWPGSNGQKTSGGTAAAVPPMTVSSGTSEWSRFSYSRFEANSFQVQVSSGGG